MRRGTPAITLPASTVTVCAWPRGSATCTFSRASGLLPTPCTVRVRTASTPSPLGRGWLPKSNTPQRRADRASLPSAAKESHRLTRRSPFPLLSLLLQGEAPATSHAIPSILYWTGLGLARHADNLQGQVHASR